MFETVRENRTNTSFTAQNGKHSFFKLRIQPKLTINQPNDIYEQEADAVADKVMRTTGNGNKQELFFKPAVTPVQRKCEHCEKEEKKMQRKEIKNNSTTDASYQTENYINSLSGGKPLSKNERSFFEPKMGYDFSNVKIHTNAEAAKSAQSINALAYTTGNNIVFNEGEYASEIDSGKKLLAHELTHVVQQQAEVRAIQRYTETTEPNSHFGEFAADIGSILFTPYGIGRGIHAANCLQNLEQPMIDITFGRWIRHVCGRTTPAPLHSREWDAFGHCWVACEGSRACGETPTAIAGGGRELYREFQRFTGARPHDSFTQDVANQAIGRRLAYTAGTCYALCDNAHLTRSLNLTAPQATCIDCANIAAGEGTCPP